MTIAKLTTIPQEKKLEAMSFELLCKCGHAFTEYVPNPILAISLAKRMARFECPKCGGKEIWLQVSDD